MSQVIVLEKNRALSDLLTINLRTFAGAEVIQMDDLEKVKELLQILPAIDLIITRAESENESFEKGLVSRLKELKKEVPVISFGKRTSKIHLECVHIENERKWDEIITTATKILGITEESLRSKPRPDYISIPVRYFLLIDHALCDVFIRIKKSPTEYQYIKRIHAGDDYSREVIERYLGQGLKEFYIPKDFEVNFANFASDKLVTAIEKSIDNFDEMIHIVSQSFDFAIEETRRLGFTPATLQLTDTIISAIQKSFITNPKLNSVIHKVINQKASYMYQHCHMTNLLIFEVLNTIAANSEQMQNLFAYVSFFHDIDLVEEDKLTRINDLKSLEHAHLDKIDLDLVMNHALNGSLLLRTHPDAHRDVSKLILEHHGAVDGIGLLERYPVDLAFETRLFIVCEKFVHRFLEYKDNQKDIRPILGNFYNSFVEPEMVEIAKILEKTLIRKQK